MNEKFGIRPSVWPATQQKIPTRMIGRIQIEAITNPISPSKLSLMHPMTKRLFITLLCAVAAFTADATQCPTEQFAGGQPPRITVPALSRDTRALCSSFFSVLYSGISRTPLYSAEHLTTESVKESEEQSRINSFHADRRLPYGAGPALSDYAHSGFDRGHMQYPVISILNA